MQKAEGKEFWTEWKGEGLVYWKARRGAWDGESGWMGHGYEIKREAPVKPCQPWGGGCVHSVLRSVGTHLRALIREWSWQMIYICKRWLTEVSLHLQSIFWIFPSRPILILLSELSSSSLIPSTDCLSAFNSIPSSVSLTKLPDQTIQTILSLPWNIWCVSFVCMWDEVQAQ